MIFTLSFYLSISCLIPAITGTLLMNRLDKKLYPFLANLWLAVVVELTVGILVAQHWPLIVSIMYNIFIPANFLLLLIFFFRNEIIEKNSGSVPEVF